MRGAILFTILAAELASLGAGPGRPGEVHPYFRGAPELRLKSTGPLGVVSIVQPQFFAPSTGKPGRSLYICGVGQMHEVRMDTGAVRRHRIPFDFKTRVLYMAGVRQVWLGPDLKVYLAMNGSPGRMARFDPETAKVEMLGSLEGCGWQGGAVRRYFLAPGGKCYLITYNAMLSELDMATGRIRTLGRLADDAIYVHGRAWVGVDGWFYCTAGQRPGRKVRMNLATGEREFLDEFPDVAEAEAPKPDFPDGAKLYDVTVTTDGDRATVTFGPKGGDRTRTVAFTCTTIARDMHTVGVGPDGKVYGCGSYNHFIFDPATGKTVRPRFHYNIYDYLAVGDMLYFSGYPNARLGAYDTARPLRLPVPARGLWMLRAAEHNPFEVLNIYNVKDPTGETLKMKRCWSLALGVDGLIYAGSSATRQNRGGSLVVMNPKDHSVVRTLRAPFKLLGVSEVSPVDGGRLMALVTWVSPDPNYPGQEPDAGRLFLYDVQRKRIIREETPLPGVQVLKSVVQAPGMRRLVGLGLRGVRPAFDMDDAFFGNGELFFYDLDAGKTLKRIAFAFPLSRREGRAIVAAPDGSLWVSGGGGIVRINPQEMTAEPLATCPPSGNMTFLRRTLFMVGGTGLRYGDVSAFLRR